MLGSKGKIRLAVVAVLASVVGCSSSPWSTGSLDTSEHVSPEAPPPPVQPDPAPAQQGATSADPRAMSKVLDELQVVGELDPAAQAKLLEDLKRTDPSLWPLVVQQFRAALAYKRQTAETAMAGPASGKASSALVERPPALPQPQTAKQAPASLPEAAKRLPAPSDAALAPADPPGGSYPSTGANASNMSKQLPATKPSVDRVVTASYQQETSTTWREHVRRAIAALESEVRAQPQSAEDLAEHARLRLLYLLDGRRDDALRPLPSAGPSIEAFWANEIYGLDAWLDHERAPEQDCRAREAKGHLVEAVANLAELAPLVVRNLEFCSAVHSYGSLKRFERREFIPYQELLLYAEVENFKTTRNEKGYYTKLRGSYHIYDASGNRVAEYEFPITEETCDRPRRDFFIGYHLRLPKRIYPGKHTLQLSIEDLQSQKIGQSTIDFTIKESPE